MTKKVAVDAGPERHGEITVDDVTSILEKAGFEVTRYKDMVFAKRAN